MTRVAVCSRCQSPIEQGDLRCAICSLATERRDDTDRRRLQVQVLRCDGCGATVSYDVRQQAPLCAFCGSATHVEVPSDPMEQTELFVPFTVDIGTARQALRRWLRQLGFFRPSDLVSEARLESLRPLWWVAWVFDAEALVSWTIDSDAGARRSDWAPHAGQTAMRFSSIAVPASRGLSEQEAMRLIPSFDLGSASPEPNLEQVRGVVEQFDVQRSLARRFIVAAIERLAARRVRAPGRRFRKLQTAILLRQLVTRRFAFPTHVMAYRYKGRLYRIVVSGQNASCLLGDAPYSWLKIVSVAGGALLLIFALVATLISL